MTALPDRRRVNGPSGVTSAPQFTYDATQVQDKGPTRSRVPGELRKIFLKSGLTPSASGSAYLELEPSLPPKATSLASTAPRSGLKLTCTVHGPRPLPRSAPFSHQIILTTRVKFAPFATQQRRGYVPDPNERELAAHLETALRGVLLAERWPKSGVDIIITILEGEEDCPTAHMTRRTEGWGTMTILSGCITVASAAIADAGIDCLDLVTGGMAALVPQPTGPPQLVLDPCPSDHEEIRAACVVAYAQSSDEITEVWAKGDGESSGANVSESLDFGPLLDNAVKAASMARLVLVEALKESMEAKLQMLTPSRAPESV
ncbi:MAG: hypothetical protein Q9163_000879 [Psora crenata]